MLVVSSSNWGQSAPRANLWLWNDLSFQLSYSIRYLKNYALPILEFNLVKSYQTNSLKTPIHNHRIFQNSPIRWKKHWLQDSRQSSQLHWGRGLLSTRRFTSGRTLVIMRPVQLPLKSFRPLVRSEAGLVHHTWILVLKPAPSLISDLSWLLSSLCEDMLIYAISQLATEIEEVSPTQPSAWVKRMEVRRAGATGMRESVSMQLMRGINQEHGRL